METVAEVFEEKIEKPRSQGLTNAQRRVMKALKKSPGSFIVFHKKITGTEVYRLLSSDRTPITNFAQRPVDKLVSIGKLQRNAGIITLIAK